jgi:hypothetical protein
MQTDLAIDPAGNVWVMNNWQDIDSCFPGAEEALSTLCGGQGVTVFYGMAKPVRAPQIGPARAPAAWAAENRSWDRSAQRRHAPSPRRLHENMIALN